MDNLSCSICNCAPGNPVLSVLTGMYIFLLDQLSCGGIFLCSSVALSDLGTDGNGKSSVSGYS